MSSNQVEVESTTRKTLVLSNTVSTRKYPFTQETLDQIRELRQEREDEIFESSGEEIMVPTPIILADAVDLLHKQTFNKG